MGARRFAALPLPIPIPIPIPTSIPIPIQPLRLPSHRPPRARQRPRAGRSRPAATLGDVTRGLPFWLLGLAGAPRSLPASGARLAGRAVIGGQKARGERRPGPAARGEAAAARRPSGAGAVIYCLRAVSRRPQRFGGCAGEEGERHRAAGRRVERGGEEGGGRASPGCAGDAEPGGLRGNARARQGREGREGANEGGRGRGRREGGGDFFYY